MLRTFDVVLIVVMTAAATVTYTIKHQAENKFEDVRRLDAAIKLEEDTIELLRADWALLTQPNRLEKLVTVYEKDLQLAPTPPTQLAHPQELPMMKADVPPPKTDGKGGDKTKIASAGTKAVKTASAAPEESVEEIIEGAGEDSITTGAVAR